MPHLPSAIRNSKTLRNIFFNIIDEKAYVFIAKKVAKQNGDIRVAFDMMKTSLNYL